jgi:glucose/arabinose dehydrogenase
VQGSIAFVAVLAAAALAAAPARAQDRAYEIPPDNPFVDTPGARGEIYLYGMRNPFRWSFDRLTGDMIVGDVGGSVREEIDVLTAGEIAGANLGWNCREGKVDGPGECEAPGAVEPIYDFPNTGGDAVIGGYVVRDPELPQWQGRYLFSSIKDGIVRWLDPAAPPETGAAPSTGLTVPAISSFGEDGIGRLYATSLSDGSVYRLGAGPGDTLTGTALPFSFDRPMAVAAPPGDPDRLFVAERGGALQLVVDGDDEPREFLAVETTTDGERGLLGVAVAPDFATSGLVYVFYTTVDGDLQIDQFRRSATDPTTADPASRRPILTIPHREASNHNGGQLLFGPDRYLYLSTGDGGSQGDPEGDAQSLGSLLGKIIRIDPVVDDEPPPPPPPPDTTPPVIEVSAPKSQRMLQRGGVAVSARCDEDCRLFATGRLTVGGRSLRLRGATEASPAGRWTRITVPLTRHSRKPLRRALRRHRHPTATVTLGARDEAGNVTRRLSERVRAR